MLLPKIVRTESPDGASIVWELLPAFTPGVPNQYCADGDGMFAVVLVESDTPDAPSVDAPTWYVRTDCSGYLYPLSAAAGIDEMLHDAHSIMRVEDGALFDSIRVDAHAPANYPPTYTVRDVCNGRWFDTVTPEVLDCPAHSAVGADSLRVMRATDALIELMPDAAEFHNDMITGAAKQCRVFCFG